MTESTPGPLTRAEKGFLLDLAHRAVSAAARGETAPDPVALAAQAGLDLSRRLMAPCGAFVTLHKDGQLRGCIGYIAGIKPLCEAVRDNGAAAAVGDPRFPPVTPAELDQLDLEISALSPLNRVSGPLEIDIGRHGILFAKSGRQSVFLPQVAVEQGWDLDTTLTHLALKAGLAADAWRTGAEFQVFEADVF